MKTVTLVRRVDPAGIGWPLGRAHEPRGGDLWVPWDRTAGVIGPQGSGKTLDLLIPALLAAPGAALVTLGGAGAVLVLPLIQAALAVPVTVAPDISLVKEPAHS